jgi:hypothetical protein
VKRLAVSDIHIIPSVWRKGNDLMSIMSQTTFQAFLDYVGVGRPTGKLQQSQTERPVWSGESVYQIAIWENFGYSRFDDLNSLQ